MSKVVRIRLPNPEVWQKFIQFIEKKHGKVWGLIGFELQNAILNYMETHDTHTSEEAQKITDLKSLVYTNVESDGGTYYPKDFEVRYRLSKILEFLRKVKGINRGRISKTSLEKEIKKLRLSPAKYIRMLIELGYLDIDLSNYGYFIINC